MWGNYLLAEGLLDSQEGLRSMKLVYNKVYEKYLYILLFS
jgi:hypothetical protein